MTPASFHNHYPIQPESCGSECDPQQFRLAMRRFPASVCIVATGQQPHRRGLTATAVCSLTADPPQILVCLNAGTGTCKAILRNRKFSVNVLRHGDAPIAQRFAGIGSQIVSGDGRFNDEDWDEGRKEAPVLRRALLVLECDLAAQYLQRTHTIMVGRVGTISTRDHEAVLIYGQGKFGPWAPPHAAME